MTSKGSKLTREEFKQKQEVEAARKAGTLPAEVDALTGKEINPHIPQYILQAPWYLDAGVPTLQHQRPQKEEKLDDKSNWYARGAREVTQITKFRKGACENCGAMTHKLKDCTERPRKLGAKVTGKDLQADEVVQNLELGYDAKRDRYNGYNPEDFIEHIKEFEKIEEKRKELKAKELEKKLQDPNYQGETETVNDEDKYADEADMVGQKVDLKSRTSIRHLRIREDTAKYLRNLDPNSAYYDPKTRSMRDNPNKDKDPSELDYAGDNFVRYSGEAKNFSSMQTFCWDAGERGGADVTLQANPTQAELMNKTFSEKKEELKNQTKQTILERYGGAEHLEQLPRELIFAQSEAYVQYSRTGQVIKGQALRLAKSRYEEDVYPNNHTSVWGSYWEDGRWGYACCHQFIKNSYCTGIIDHSGPPSTIQEKREASVDKDSDEDRAKRHKKSKDE